MQRMDSQRNRWALLACLAFTLGCTPLLKWDRQEDLALDEIQRQPPAEFQAAIEPERKTKRVDDDPPPVPPGEALVTIDVEKAVPPQADTEPADHLGAAGNLTPEYKQFLSSRAGNPAERNLARMHSDRGTDPSEGDQTGNDLLRNNPTMPPPNLAAARRQELAYKSPPTGSTLGPPEPLADQSSARTPLPSTNRPDPQMPVVEYGPRSTTGEIYNDPNRSQRMPPAGDLRPAEGSPAATAHLGDRQGLPTRLPQVEYGPQSAPGFENMPYPDPYQQQTLASQQPYSHSPPSYTTSPPSYNTPNAGAFNTEVQYGQPPQMQSTASQPPPTAGHRDDPTQRPNPKMINNPHVNQSGVDRNRPVVQASHDSGYPTTLTPNGMNPNAPGSELASANWRKHLEMAIAALEAEIHQAMIIPNEDPQEPGAPRRLLPMEQQQIAELDARLRMLYLIAGMRDSAVMPVEHYDADNQEFYKHAMNGLSVYLDREKHPVDDRRLKLALRGMRQAVDELSSASSLDVHNLAFCSRVNSFGSYEEFPEYRFTAGQELLLYVEVENFASEQKQKGFETALLGSYHIYDAGKGRVANHTFIEEVEVCRNRRRDYFVTYRMWIPEEIAPGRYTLQLTVEDLKGNTSGQASIRFEIE